MGKSTLIGTSTFLANSAAITAFVSVTLWCLTWLPYYLKAKISSISCLNAEVEYTIEILQKFMEGWDNILDDVEVLKSELNDGLTLLANYSEPTAI